MYTGTFCLLHQCHVGKLGYGITNWLPHYLCCNCSSSSLFCYGSFAHCADQQFDRRWNHGKQIKLTGPKAFQIAPTMDDLLEYKSEIPRERTKVTDQYWAIQEQEGDYTRRLQKNEIMLGQLPLLRDDTDVQMRNMRSDALSEPEMPLRKTTLSRVLEALTKGHGDDHPI